MKDDALSEAARETLGPRHDRLPLPLADNIFYHQLNRLYLKSRGF